MTMTMVMTNLPASSGLTLLIVIVQREELPERCILESFQMMMMTMMIMMVMVMIMVLIMMMIMMTMMIMMMVMVMVMVMKVMMIMMVMESQPVHRCFRPLPPQFDTGRQVLPGLPPF